MGSIRSRGHSHYEISIELSRWKLPPWQIHASIRPGAQSKHTRCVFTSIVKAIVLLRNATPTAKLADAIVVVFGVIVALVFDSKCEMRRPTLTKGGLWGAHANQLMSFVG